MEMLLLYAVLIREIDGLDANVFQGGREQTLAYLNKKISDSRVIASLVELVSRLFNCLMSVL